MQPIEKLEGVSWFPFSDEPLLGKELVIRSFRDPQVLLPEEAIDRKWHLFVHSWLGLHHYTSDSGIAWEPLSMVEIGARSPFIYAEGGVYHLLYEKRVRDIPLVGRRRALREDGKDDRASRIEICSSTDLATWSRPRTILDSRDVSFGADYIGGPTVSRPQLFKVGGVYRLYYGVSHVVMPDVFQTVERYFACAESPRLDGLFKPADGEPLLLPRPDDPWTNLGVGSVRVLQGREGFAAFQCGAFWDAGRGRSRTAMLILSSPDGLKWKRASEKPLLFPPESGWASGIIRGCDVRYKASEDCWYCYYCAGRTTRLKTSEDSIGLLIGQKPEPRELKASREAGPLD